MSKIWDCFTYFNEEEILRVRLEELNDIVDYFVVVESSITFTGERKPLYFDSIGEWIDPWRNRIIRVSDRIISPDHRSAWERETHQRNAIRKGIFDAAPDDIVIISDVDEIPRATMIRRNGPLQLDTVQYFWGPHWQVPQHCNQGARPVVVRKKDLTTPQELRAANLPRIPNAAWHFSFFDADRSVQEKLAAFSHTEFDKTEYKDAKLIEERIKKGIDPFDRFPLKWTEIDETYPLWIQKNNNNY